MKTAPRKRIPTKSWKLAANEASTLADRLGRPIDPKILHAVAALRARGFDTTGSCEGHLGHGEPYPWIDVGARPLTEAMRSSLDAKRTKLRLQRMRAANLRAQRRFLSLLDGFYAERQTEASLRLVLKPFGIYGAFTVVPQAAAVQAILPRARRRRMLERFRFEFDAFAAFVRAGR